MRASSDAFLQECLDLACRWVESAEALSSDRFLMLDAADGSLNWIVCELVKTEWFGELRSVERLLSPQHGCVGGMVGIFPSTVTSMLF